MQMKKQPPINAVYTWLVWPNKKKKKKKNAQVTHRWINFSSKWTIYEFWGPADTETCVNLALISPRPHTVRHELGCVSTWWIVSHCGHCCGRARPGAVASSFAQRVGLGPAPWCCFSVCCIVSGPLWGGAAERIVLPSWGYCPTPMCLFMLLASLSGQPQFHATGPPRSHSRRPPDIGPVAESCNPANQAGECVRLCEGEE